MIRHIVFYGFLALVIGGLLYSSFGKKDGSLAIVAEVEPQKTAISFHKSIRIKSLLVKEGQQVKKGDLLLVAERPQLTLDIERTKNDQLRIEESLVLVKDKYVLDKKMAELEHFDEMEKIQLAIDQIKTELEQDAQVYKQLSKNNEPPENPELKTLLSRKEITRERFSKTIKNIELKFQLEKEQLRSRLLEIKSELTVLNQESESLEQYAPIDGTIGSISAQLMELVPPFQTIISIYDQNPDLIKAYLNENSDISVTPGQSVKVESTNRAYSIEGKVIEIGARIISYPKQLNPINTQQLWGKEIFIQIPKENQFLNGEKVYVIIPGS